MEAGSDGNSPAAAADGLNKPKRQMKTPFQLEILEKTYKAEVFPTEASRLQLSEQLGLTDRQLKMWFCHRRLKDKKSGTPAGKTELLEPSRKNLMVADHGSDHGSRSRSQSELRSRTGSGSRSRSESSQFEEGDDVALVRRVYQPSPQRIVCRVIDCVEAQLGESLREDGPVLGMEFDDLPPGAFGTPIVPPEALQSHWVENHRNPWGIKLDAAVSTGDHLQKPSSRYAYAKNFGKVDTAEMEQNDHMPVGN